MFVYASSATRPAVINSESKDLSKLIGTFTRGTADHLEPARVDAAHVKTADLVRPSFDLLSPIRAFLQLLRLMKWRFAAIRRQYDANSS